MKASLALYQALRSINVSEEKAAAVIEAMETDMQSTLATKADVAALELRLTIRMGFMLSAAVGVLIAALKFMH